MFALNSFLIGFGVMLTVAFATWVLSLLKRDVSIVDSLWPLLFFAAAATYAATVPQPGPRATLVLVMVGVWALRLSGYLTWRNWGEPEDRRYQTIRRHNEPHFALKSLYLIFGLQGTLAWIISLPLLAAIAAQGSITVLDYAGVALWGIGRAHPGRFQHLVRLEPVAPCPRRKPRVEGRHALRPENRSQGLCAAALGHCGGRHVRRGHPAGAGRQRPRSARGTTRPRPHPAASTARSGARWRGPESRSGRCRCRAG